MIPFSNRLFAEAMLFNLKAIQTVDSGLLRLTLQPTAFCHFVSYGGGLFGPDPENKVTVNGLI